MRFREILAALGIALALVLSSVLAEPARAGNPCDLLGYARPCNVRDGFYRARVPEGEGPFPAVLYLYGSGGKSSYVADSELIQDSIVGRGYALIVPAALNQEYTQGYFDTGWALRHEPRRPIGGEHQTRDDIAFIDRVLTDAESKLNIDRSRVVMVGQSRGGFFLWELACHNPEMAAGFVIHAGGYLGRMPETCAGPVRFLHSHGLQDPIVPYVGSLVSGGVRMEPIAEGMKILARTDGCDPEPAEPKPMYSMARISWTNCADGASLDLLLHEGGHFMPPDWFRAVLDWFEETPESRPVSRPQTLTAGTRSEGRFKARPTGGTLLGVTRTEAAEVEPEASGPQRLRPPGPGESPLTRQDSQ